MAAIGHSNRVPPKDPGRGGSPYQAIPKTPCGRLKKINNAAVYDAFEKQVQAARSTVNAAENVCPMTLMDDREPAQHPAGPMLLVARGPGWELYWPFDRWQALSDMERAAVVERQRQLFEDGRADPAAMEE